jgi:hypothetical protein
VLVSHQMVEVKMEGSLNRGCCWLRAQRVFLAACTWWVLHLGGPGRRGADGGKGAVEVWKVRRSCCQEREARRQSIFVLALSRCLYIAPIYHSSLVCMIVTMIPSGYI